MTKLTEVMTNEVVYLLPTANVYQAASLMKKLNVGIIPICDEKRRLLGVVTDRDIVLRVVAEGKNIHETYLIDIATQYPLIAQKDWDISTVVDAMSQHQVRRLPVVEGERLVGLVSIGDIALHASAANATIALKGISQPALSRRAYTGYVWQDL